MSREQLDLLLNELVPLAQQFLAKHGEFFPFAAVLKSGGEVAPIAGYTGDERPKSQEVIDTILAGLRSQRQQCIAIGLCSDVRVTPPG